MGTKELKETAARLVSYIDNILVNLELDSDAEWHKEEKTDSGLEKLIQDSKIAGMQLKELSDEGHTFVVVYDQGKDADYESVKEVLMSALFSEKTVSGSEEDLAGKAEVSSQKLPPKELHILYRIPDVSTRMNRESIFQEKKNKSDLKKALNDKNKKFSLPTYGKIKIHYICDTPVYKEEISLEEINRFDVLQMPEREHGINFAGKQGEEVLTTGYVLTVQLKQLVEIYNKVGDVLFKRNVRYGLEEQFGVDAAIKNTLKREPQKFWFRNNGVTIIIQDPEFMLDKSSKITLPPKGKDGLPGFSVINGAQTITTSAEYYYALKNSVQTQEVKEELKNFEKANVLLRLIHFKTKKEEQGKEVNEVSVALNRQKPIKAEDIAYTAPQIIDMLDYMNEHRDCEFTLVKRGETSPVGNGVSLIDIARAMKAINKKPGEARTQVAAKLLKQDPETRELKEKDVFPDLKGNDSAFEKTYKWVYFAHSAARLYTSILENKVLVLEDNKATIFSNGKWYFTAYLIQCLCDAKIQKETGVLETADDRRKLLDALNKPVKGEKAGKGASTCLAELIRLFVEHVDKIIDSPEAKANMENLKIKSVDSNTFKSDKLFQFILDKHDTELRKAMEEGLRDCVNGKMVGKNGNETNNADKPTEKDVDGADNTDKPAGENENETDKAEKKQSKDRVIIRVVEMNEEDGSSKKINVNRTKEALYESVKYLANKYPHMQNQLNNISWITEDKKSNRSETIHLWGRIYYLNTNAGSEDMKKRLDKLLRILELPKDSIFWYEEGKNIPYQLETSNTI